MEVTAISRDAVSIPVTEASQVGEARRAAAVMAERAGFDQTSRGAIALAVTEVATNLARHASGGEVVLRLLPGEGGLEVLALDRGPGIADVAGAFRDGFSTGGTPGTGLGSARRMADVFEVCSTVPAGTAVLARFHPPALPPVDAGALTVGSVCLPVRGEEACGDACFAADLGGGRTAILLADGLGHGPQAAEASAQAVRLFRQNVGLDLPRLFHLLHAGLRATRGAAVAVADVRRREHLVRYAGVGNISGAVVTGGGTRSMVSHNGTVGAEMRRVQEFTYPWPDDAVLVMHSDGLATRWQLDKYPGLRFKHPALIAGVLYRDFRRDRDDVTVLVAAVPRQGRT